MTNLNNTTKLDRMAITVPRMIRRAGLIPAVFFAILSLWSMSIGYQIWQNPTQYVVVRTDSTLVLHSAIIIAVLLLFSVFSGIALKIYQWSMATPNKTGTTDDK